MIKRPKPGEDEEDILRMQEEFLREKSSNESHKPSAQVINLRRTEHRTTKRSNTTEPNIRKPSVYAKLKGLNQNENKDMPRKLEEDDDNVYFPKLKAAVMGDIVQKNYNIVYDFDQPNPMPTAGFPIVTKSTSADVQNANVPQVEKTDETKSAEMEVDETSQEINALPSNQQSIGDPLNLPTKSYILSNKDADVIHKENVDVLKKMSEEEILEEQKKLLSSLDPNLVEFLKTKRKQTHSQKGDKVGITINEKEEEMVVEQKALQEENDDTLWDNDILSHPEVDSWLHFDTLEKDKLQWLKGLKDSEVDKPDEPYEARFDFEGYLLPYTVEYTEQTKTLFHHGEEPHRPGYSISELIELSRSSITQQRVMSLNTIAGILQYFSAGTYRGIIDIPLSKIFFVIRFAMDENKLIILEPALKAMSNLLFNKIDEACLDALTGFEESLVQPYLENDKSEIEELDSKESELKDFHLAEIDIIAAILRTDILQRLYYIMDIIKPSYNCVQYSLQILTRLARDSIETTNKIVQTEHLITTIIRNFIPTTGVNFKFDPNIVYKGKPILEALKLMRVISLQSRDIGNMLISKYDIMRPISEYINFGVESTYGWRLQIESYCILRNFVSYDIGVDEITALLPVILTTLYKHVQGTNIYISSPVVSSTHAAVVLQLINQLFNNDRFELSKHGTEIYPLIKDGLSKWMGQVARLGMYACGQLRVVCSVLECCNTIIKRAKVPLTFLSDAIRSLSKTKGIRIMMDNLMSNSNLLSGMDEDFSLTPNLVSLRGSAMESMQNVIPALKVSSPVPFLLSIFKILVAIDDKKIAEPYIEMVFPYLSTLINVEPSLTLNWFTRMETDLVFNIIKLCVQCNTHEDLKDIIYIVANKLCFILRLDKHNQLKFVFDNVIFNRQWFTTQRLFSMLIVADSEELPDVLTSTEDIKLCYAKVIQLRSLENTPNIVLRKWQEPLLPRDWIYLPILSLYSKMQDTPPPSVTGDHTKRTALLIAQEKELIIRCSLEWILFNELCFPDLLNDIKVTDRLCRIMCVFLCDNSLFLDEKIKFLLRHCMKRLFKKSVEFNFDKPMIGLSNFQDFYTQLLEQFQSVSYGDHNFAACVLIPLAQHHNVKWRKTLWSEYAGCLRSLDCPDDYLCYKLDKYLQPEETDESLIKCYFRALASNLLRPGTIVHKIASHHTESFKNRLHVSDSDMKI